MAGLPCRRAVRIFWGHREADAVLGGACLELQRMAAAAGVSYWDPDSYLSLHPKYGPWFALRAVIVFDGVEYLGAAWPCPALCCPSFSGLACTGADACIHP